MDRSYMFCRIALAFKFWPAVLVICTAMVCIGAPAPRDSVAPVLNLVEPHELAVLTTCPVLLRALAQDSQSGIHSVVFMVEYRPAGVWSGSRCDTLAVDSIPPYETRWYCSRVPEQSWADLRALAFAIDKAGNRSPTVSVPLILDRNPALSDASLQSSRTTGRPIIDGKALQNEPWSGCTPLDLSSGSNRYEFRTLWDRSMFYAFIKVYDHKVVLPDSTVDIPLDIAASTHRFPWEFDCIGLLFDPGALRREVPAQESRMLYITANGGVWGVIPEPATGQTRSWKHKGRIAVVHDSLPEDSLGYSVEIALPWKDLGIKPADGGVFGFELILADRDRHRGLADVTGWAGPGLPWGNPSEWGMIVLKDGSANNAANWLFLLVGAMILVAVATLLFRPRPKRRNNKTGSLMAIQHSRENDPALDSLVKQAEDFVRLHFMAQEISTALVARKLHVSAGYLSKVFKQQTGRSIGSFVVFLRIEKSLDFLDRTTRPIADVGLAVGFVNPDQFIRAFKAEKGVSPREYRQAAAVRTGSAAGDSSWQKGNK